MVDTNSFAYQPQVESQKSNGYVDLGSSVQTNANDQNQLLTASPANPLMRSQQSPSPFRRTAPTSPIFTGDYEMQTDLADDLSRQSTMKRSAKKQIARRKRIRENGEVLERDTEACMAGCHGPKCQIF